MELLKCKHCDSIKPATEFHKYRRSKCIECTRAYNRASYVKHREKRLAYESARESGWERSGRCKYEQGKEVKWGSHLKRMYGITESDFYAMWERQGKVCAICRKECNKSSRTKLCVDHCHKTGKVRGLLCFKCNTGLGRFNDDTNLFEQAIKYLRGEM